MTIITDGSGNIFAARTILACENNPDELKLLIRALLRNREQDEKLLRAARDLLSYDVDLLAELHVVLDDEEANGEEIQEAIENRLGIDDKEPLLEGE